MNATNLTETQVETLWRESGDHGMWYLMQMCECWLDADGVSRPTYEATIRSYVKGSKLAAAVGL